MKFDTAIPHRGSEAGISSAPLDQHATLLLEHEPRQWSRWLDWMPKVRLPPLPAGPSPFTSPANTSLQQRVFLNGTATEVSLK